MTQQRCISVFSVSVFLIPILGLVAPKMLPVLLGVMSLFSAVIVWRPVAQRMKTTIFQPLSILLALFLILSAASCIWSIEPKETLITTLKFISISIIGFFFVQFILTLNKEQKMTLLYALYTGILVSTIAVMLDYFLGNPWQKYRNFTSAKAFATYSLLLSFSLWPAALWMIKRKIPLAVTIPFYALIFCAMLVIDCDTPILGFFLGCIVAITTYYIPRITIVSIAIAMIVGTFIAPIIAYHTTPENIDILNKHIRAASYIDRLHIWHRLSHKIKERPLLGWGIKGTRSLPGKTETFYFPFTDKEGKKHMLSSFTTPYHAHNFALELWIELGVLGAMLGALFISYVLYTIYKIKDQATKSMTMGLFTAATIAAAVSLSIFQIWWLCVLIMVITLVTQTHQDARRHKDEDENGELLGHH